MTRLEQLTQFLSENPQDPFLRYALTMEHVKLGDDNEALQNFEDMIQQFPDYVGTYYHFGKLLERLGDGIRARDIYRQGIRVAGSARNRHAMGELQGALNQLEGFGDDEDEY